MRKVTNQKIRRKVFYKIWKDKALLNEITTNKATIDIELEDKLYQIWSNGFEFYIYRY